MPRWMFNQFMSNGYHTIRRSNKFWGGISTDLAIEQILMRTLKSRGGLTRGRGFTESVRILWIYSMHRCAGIHQSMSDFTELQLAFSEQHVEMRVSRIKRDFEDINKMITLLQNHNPFDDTDPSLRSLSSGQASDEKDGINCDIAEDVGIIMQKKIDNKSYTKISFKRNDQVRTLESIRKGIRIADDTIHIDPMLLFSRLFIQVERSENIQFLFAYELAPIPTALFKDYMMRKGKKSSLSSFLKDGVTPAEISEMRDARFVIDGGALLHCVYRKSDFSFMDVVYQYVVYIKNNFGDACTVVFDGYQASTKDYEHSRRECG